MAEIILDDNALIISETDKRGRILYSNDEFLHYSGYSWDEIYYKSHNMLRHPDMPKETFKDLWQTIQSGATWYGLVKNKTKNGDFYWVFSTITPIISEDDDKRYLALRKKPTKEEIAKYGVLHQPVLKKLCNANIPQ